jgi:hypothetical protein
MPLPVNSQEWIKVLSAKLEEQARRVTNYEIYYEGKQTANLSLMSTVRYQEFFYNMFKSVSDNWMPIVVDAVDERLLVQGFRMTKDTKGDDEAWKFWQYNNFDIHSKALFTSILSCGIAYVMVWHSGDSDYPVLLTAEHANEVYVAVDYQTGIRVAAIKKWKDEWSGEERVNLYFPDRIEKWIKIKGQTDYSPLFGEEVIPNPLGKVPIVPFRNRINLKRDSWCSEIHDVMSTQDQINKLVMDLLISSEFGAFRQRWATGLDVPVDKETGKPVQMFQAAIDRMWATGDPGVTFGEFSATDLGNFVRAIENRVQSLASRSRTPAHYLLGQSGTFPSGETLKATETGLIAKVKRHQLEYDDPLEETVRLGFAVMGDSRSKIRDSEVIWGDPESRTESEHIDATVKKLALDIPLEQLWLDAGYTVTQIQRFWQMMKEEKAIRAAMGLLPPEGANQGQASNNGAPNGSEAPSAGSDGSDGRDVPAAASRGTGARSEGGTP